MYLSLLFWLALLLPGYAAVRCVLRTDGSSLGLPGLVSLCYVACLAVLSPFSIACYLTHAPMWVFSIVCVALIVASVALIHHRNWWSDLGRVVMAGLCLELVVVVLDLVATARIGAFFNGDAGVHLARIRFLIDHGFSNFDPFVADQNFFPIYHTNIIHALHAACAQLTGGDYLGNWFINLVWAKIVIAGGAFYLARTVFDRDWPAWVAALTTLAINAPVSFLLYPNKLAALWLLPMVIAFVVQACAKPNGWQSVVKIGAGCLVLAQVHSLYAAFVALAVGPVIAVLFLSRLIRRRERAGVLVACLAALAIPLPFLLISSTNSRPPAEKVSKSPLPATAAVVTGPPSRFIHFDNGWVMTNPRRGFGGAGGWKFFAIAGGAAIGLLSKRRREVAILTGVVAATALVLYTPPLCTIALDVFRQQWVLARFQTIMATGFVVLVPAMAAFAVERHTRYRVVRAILSLAIGFGATTLASRSADHSWARYRERVALSHDQRHEVLDWSRRARVFFGKNLPPGETVLLADANSLSIVMVHDCYVVASPRASVGVADVGRRRRERNVMLAAQTPWPQRQALLQQHGVKYLVQFRGDGADVNWAQGHFERQWPAKDEGYLLVRLRTG